MVRVIVPLAVVVTACFALGACGEGSSTPTGASSGARVYAEAGCGSCHTLKAAGSSGTAAANLDERRLDARAVERWVREGGEAMPAYERQLSPFQIRAVARYVARNAGR